MLFLHLLQTCFHIPSGNISYSNTLSNSRPTTMISLSPYCPLSSTQASSSPLLFFGFKTNPNRIFLSTKKIRAIVCLASSDDVSPNSRVKSTSDFCIIQGPETVQDFASMQLQEIQDNIKSRRNKIFLLMEEMRRLRVQERLKSPECSGESLKDEDDEMINIPSSIPFLPNMTHKKLRRLYLTSFVIISGIIFFGGLIAPSLEVKLGFGGTSYVDFIQHLHLPKQLSQVDPIVASFSGGAVGVISALMLLEHNNVKQQEEKKCKYCHGTGYLACARCSGSGLCLSTEPISANTSNRPLSTPTTERCPNCSGAGKVMCPACLCTGMAMATEHDQRIEPFDY